MTADELQGQITAYATSAYVASMQAASAQLDSAVNSANQLYVKAAAQAGAEAGVIGSEKALRHALNTLASQGVSVSTYTRKDGTVVHTPVDVGVRRMINDELRQRNIQQVRELAQELGRNYVEVSITANCRESHEPWQGQIYSIDPSDDTYPYFDTACNVGDPVDGFGGYNCGHQIHIYRPEIGRTFTDPLEGTGYTTEEVRALTTKQRALENNIRKTKREIECLKAAGLDATAEQARLRNYQQQLSTLLKENSAVLTSGGAYRTAVNRAQGVLLSSDFKDALSAVLSGETSGRFTKEAGEDFLRAFQRNYDYKTIIEDVIHQIGNDGKLKVVTLDDFIKAVNESGIVGTRAYVAVDKKTLQSYRDMLYSGEWYVSCDVGGAQYGCGMYMAANYEGQLTGGHASEMNHYLNGNYRRTGMGSVGYVEYLTLDEDAKIITYEDLKNKWFSLCVGKLDYEGTIEFVMKYFDLDEVEATYAVCEALDEVKLATNYQETKEKLSAFLRDNGVYDDQGNYISKDHLNVAVEIAGIGYRTMEHVFEGFLVSDISDEIKRQFQDDYGAIAAALGYDAIKAEGHGAETYTVVLNRNKLVILSPNENEIYDENTAYQLRVDLQNGL